MKRLNIIAPLLLIAGLILMFASPSFGMALGDLWLTNQYGGSADTSDYELVIATYKNNFVIIGSLFFGIGLVMAIFAYFSSLNHQEEATGRLEKE